MALSIPPLPAVAAESPRSTMREFSQDLERLASGVRGGAAPVRPLEAPARIEPVSLAAEVRQAADSVTQARGADRNLEQLEGILGQARNLAFQAVNDRTRTARPEDQARFAELLDQGRELTADPEFLREASLSSFPASLGAIQVIDRTLSEISDQRGMLGIFQSAKLAQVGQMLRDGVAGVVSSSSVIRDRVVAVNLATSAAAAIESQRDSSLLGDSNAAGQILASLVGRL